MAGKQILTAKFKLDKETPGTFRYLEEGDKDGHKCGSIYIKKGALPGGAPKQVTVTITF